MEKPAFEAGQVWLTENNSRVRILATDIKDDYPVIGAREIGDCETIESFRADGKFNRDGSFHDLDLVKLAPKRIVVEEWINVIQIKGDLFVNNTTDRHITKEDAMSRKYSEHIIVLERAVPFKWVGEEPEAKEVE